MSFLLPTQDSWIETQGLDDALVLHRWGTRYQKLVHESIAYAACCCSDLIVHSLMHRHWRSVLAFCVPVRATLQCAVAGSRHPLYM